MTKLLTRTQAETLIAKAHDKADKFAAPVVVNIRARSIQLLRSYSPDRQAAIAERGDGEIIIQPYTPRTT